MAHTNTLAQTALANVFLARIPLTERSHAIRHLAAQVDNDTIGLVAALTESNHDTVAETDLLSFLARSIEGGEASAAASVCLQYSHIREALLGRAEEELDISLAMLLRRPKSSGVVVPTSEWSSQAPSVGVLQLGEYADRSPEDNVRTSIVYLNFMKQLFRLSTREMSCSISKTTFIALLGLLAASNADIAAAARDACFAFLAAYRQGALKVPGLEDDYATFDHKFWKCISSLLDHGPHSSYRTTAYAIWLRWLDLPEHPGSSKDMVQSEAYWEHILNALASGDIEQRKICLHVLRASLAISRNGISTKDMVLDHESSHGYHATRAQYERFCTVYETIVIGRYFNQAEECMKDLDALASSETRVQKSWLLALLEPALSNVTQDSIRKMLGNWLMSTDLSIPTHSREFAILLRKSFLPWACQGPLFTGTLKGRTNSARCEHGTRLAGFIERLFRNNASDDQVEVRLCIAQSILDFLHHNKNRIIPYAVVYLLHGLRQGLKGQMKPCMGSAQLELLLDLPTGTAFPEVSRDVVQSCCLELSQLRVQDEPLKSAKVAPTDSRLDILTQKVDQLRLGIVSGSAPAKAQWQNLTAYLEELRASRHACLSGAGLSVACRSLIAILDSTDATDIHADHLCQVLDSVWSELEIQDYPKNTLLMMPRLVLHPTCVERSLFDDTLADMLASYLSQLHQFSTGRIYVWAPLMTSLRTALIKSPSAANKLAVADLLIDTADSPPSAKMEFQLEAATVQLLGGQQGDPRYTDYYGEYEEEGYAAFFDVVNRLPQIDQELARETYNRLIEPWINQKLPVPVVNKWKTTIQLQIMLVIQEQLISTMTVPQAQHHMGVLHKILAVEPLPRYRLLIEWMIARIIIRHAETGGDILQRLSTMDHHSNPKYLSSLAKIGLMIACLEDTSEEFSYRLACRLVALSSSSKIIIRHEAQWSFPILWNVAETRGLVSITTNPACEALNEYIRSLERFSAPPTERQLEYLDPVSGHTLTNLLQGEYLRLEPSTEPLLFGANLRKLLENDRTNGLLHDTMPTGTLPLGDVSADATSKPNDALPVDATQQESKASARTMAVAALQTKGTAYLSASNTKTEESTRATDLIVVGSLVDNAYNLGGLSRVSEIFGASALYMSRPKAVLTNKDFVSVAVSSQNHLPIHDLSVENLQAFLTEKKTQGYTVVGVEQTDRSVLLGDEHTKLPPKTLLITGAEKEGIPAMVLGECDMLVEIPQRGVTRSMNVQTAAGVVLYEYSRQHRSRK